MSGRSQCPSRPTRRCSSPDLPSSSTCSVVESQKRGTRSLLMTWIQSHSMNCWGALVTVNMLHYFVFYLCYACFNWSCGYHGLREVISWYNNHKGGEVYFHYTMTNFLYEQLVWEKKRISYLQVDLAGTTFDNTVVLVVGMISANFVRGFFFISYVSYVLEIQFWSC